jgi:hypothetical protein
LKFPKIIIEERQSRPELSKNDFSFTYEYDCTKPSNINNKVDGAISSTFNSILNTCSWTGTVSISDPDGGEVKDESY